MSQQEIHPTCQSQHPSNVFIQEMIDSKGLMHQNNYRDKCANVRTNKGITAKPSSRARLISEEKPGKIYVAFTNCKTKGEYEAIHNLDETQDHHLHIKIAH